MIGGIDIVVIDRKLTPSQCCLHSEVVYGGGDTVVGLSNVKHGRLRLHGTLQVTVGDGDFHRFGSISLNTVTLWSVDDGGPVVELDGS